MQSGSNLEKENDYSGSQRDYFGNIYTQPFTFGLFAPKLFHPHENYINFTGKISDLFFFLNNKPYLKDLIPDNHVDIHSHLLPGIDDGAKSIDDTRSLLTQLQQTGMSQFITTPHIMNTVWANTAEGIQNKYLETTKAMAAIGEAFPVKAAAEYMIDSNFAKLFRSEKLLTLKDNYVLVEMSYINPPMQLLEIIFDLQVAGYIPVLAHPERYPFYHKNFSEYQKLKNGGCFFQLNLLSTIGYYGPAVADAAKKLLEKGLIDFVGSDVHHDNHTNGFNKRIIFKDSHPLREAIANNRFFAF